MLTWDATSLRVKVVEPILAVMLTPEEARSTRVEIRPGDEEGWLILRLTVGPADEFVSYLYQPPSMTGWSQREIGQKLADELHDFIAESAFGWGQTRDADELLQSFEA